MRMQDAPPPGGEFVPVALIRHARCTEEQRSRLILLVYRSEVLSCEIMAAVYEEKERYTANLRAARIPLPFSARHGRSLRTKSKAAHAAELACSRTALLQYAGGEGWRKRRRACRLFAATPR